jgi:nucleoside phosphorylase
VSFPESDYRCSFAVLTVVPEAHKCFRDAVGNPGQIEAYGYYWTRVELPALDGGKHVVVEAQTSQRSNMAAEQFTARVLRVWRPRYLLLADIGGGIHGSAEKARDGLALGDVVVAEGLHYYELMKLVPDPNNPRRERYIRWQPISPRLSTIARDLDSIVPRWRGEISAIRPDNANSSALLLGEIVAGDKLLSDPGAAEVAEIVRRYDKALAVDMESVGVAVSALEAADDGLALSYAVLRGISDWMDIQGNQATRDAWKPYAANAAVAAALALISAIPSARDVRTVPERNSVSELRRRIGDEYEIPPETYPTPVKGTDRMLTRNDVLTIAAERRGVVLAGEAGLGKTALLVQAARAAFAPLEPFPVLVDLKRWKPEFAVGLAADPTGDALRSSMDALLRASVQTMGINLLEEITQRSDVILLVDGVNEVKADVAPRILTLLQEYMRAHQAVHVLVTDRRPASIYREQGWTELYLQRLDPRDVQALLDAHLGEGVYDNLPDNVATLYRIPYFLDRAIRSDSATAASRADAMTHFLTSHVDLATDEINGLAATAYRVYERLRRRTFPREEIDRAVSDKLRDSGILVDLPEGEARFDHQLEHDYLAARHVAANSELWTGRAFDTLTFEAATFDAVTLVLEQVPVSTRDDFLTHVYNWNWNGSITALASVEEDGSEPCSPELRTVLLAVVAEKRFDQVAETSTRTTRHLSRFHDRYARDLAMAHTLKDLIGVVDRVDVGGAEWFENWRALFRRLPPCALRESEVWMLASESPLLGWTAANVIRRFPEESDVSLQVRTMYEARLESDEASRAVRWRAVHVLGAWPTDENASLVLRAVDHDEYAWVKYGAVRSSIEMAAVTRDLPLRSRILESLRARIHQIPPEPLSQLAWAATHKRADESFAESVRPLLHAALETQPNETERERWRVRIRRFEEYWESRQTS